MGLKFVLYYAQHKPVVHVLHNAVDDVGQFAFFVKFPQLIEVFAVMVVFQCMLNVAADGGINILPGTFIVPKRDLVKGGIRIVKAHIFHFQCSAVFNIRINRTDVQEPRILPKGNKRGVDRHASVVQFIAVRHSETKRVRTGNNDFHAHHAEHIGKHGSGVDEVAQECNFINKRIPIAQFIQSFQVLCQPRHIINGLHLDVGRFFYGQFGKHLKQKCCLSGPAETV